MTRFRFHNKHRNEVWFFWFCKLKCFLTGYKEHYNDLHYGRPVACWSTVDRVDVFLPSIKEDFEEDENKAIEMLCKVINHEYMHGILFDCGINGWYHHNITKRLGLYGRKIYDV